MTTPAVRLASPGPIGLRAGWPVLRQCFRARGWTSLRKQPAVLVYQMAKVGSQTVVRSLNASSPGQPVFHVHTLTADGITDMERFYRWSRVPSLPGAGHLLVSRYLREQIDTGLTPGRWKIVTMVRDPIARNLSLIFQLGRRLLPDFSARCDDGRLDPVEILDGFAQIFPAQVNCMRWFPDELESVFGVDVFATPFDRDAGHQVYHGPAADVLLLRTEDLNRRGAPALCNFLGLDQLPWRQRNIGTAKRLGSRYAKFLAELRLPNAFVDRFYNTPEVRHFYATAELDRFRARWTRGPGGAA